MKQLTVLYYFKFDADGKATILFIGDEKKGDQIEDGSSGSALMGLKTPKYLQLT